MAPSKLYMFSGITNLILLLQACDFLLQLVDPSSKHLHLSCKINLSNNDSVPGPLFTPFITHAYILLRLIASTSKSLSPAPPPLHPQLPLTPSPPPFNPHPHPPPPSPHLSLSEREPCLLPQHLIEVVSGARNALAEATDAFSTSSWGLTPGCGHTISGDGGGDSGQRLRRRDKLLAAKTTVRVQGYGLRTYK